MGADDTDTAEAEAASRAAGLGAACMTRDDMAADAAAVDAALQAWSL